MDITTHPALVALRKEEQRFAEMVTALNEAVASGDPEAAAQAAMDARAEAHRVELAYLDAANVQAHSNGWSLVRPLLERGTDWGRVRERLADALFNGDIAALLDGATLTGVGVAA